MLAYTDHARGIEGSLAYNYTGERIVLVGAENAPNIVEQARGRLDFLARYVFDLFGGRWSWSSRRRICSTTMCCGAKAVCCTNATTPA